MKKWGLILFVCLCTSSAHAQLWRDYKCFVRDASGTEWVHLVELDAEQELADVLHQHNVVLQDKFRIIWIILMMGV